MRLSNEHIKSLQALLKEQTGRDFTVEQAQAAGTAIMLFVSVKAQRQLTINNAENGNGQ